MKKVAKVLGFGSRPKTPEIKLPEPEKPAEIPDPEVLKKNAMVNEARRKKSGRASTIISDEDYLG